MKKTFSILFVCTGNSCRSPLAEIMMKSALREAGLKKVYVSSAGTAAFDGGRASEGSVFAARHLGLSLAGFTSRSLTQRRVRRADLILTMGPAQRDEITQRWPDVSDRTFVICDYTRSSRRRIADPVGHPPEVYVECARELGDEIMKVLPRVKRALKARRRKG
ncbi:MAG: low molecular weight protein arginine phosphatase [Candidatus Eisenbacteria bacterium]